MSHFVEGEDRKQQALLPSSLEDYVGEDNPARVVDVFVEKLDLGALGFEIVPAATGRPAYHPATLLKLYIYGYLNRVQSSRRLEREAQRNVELMWLTGKLAPDHKTIANFRKDHGLAIQAACAQFVVLCREIGLFTRALAAVEHHLIVAHDVVTSVRDRQQLAAMSAKAKATMGVDNLEMVADRGYFSGEEILACEALGVTPFVPKPLTSGAKADGRFGKQDFVYVREADVYRCPGGATLPRHMTTVEKGLTLHRYWDLASCRACALKPQCTPSLNRRITRWEHETVLEAMQRRLDLAPQSMMKVRRRMVEHPFGTLKAWMGSTHFLMKRLKNVKTEISLHVLAYNLKRVMQILGTGPLIAALQT